MASERVTFGEFFATVRRERLGVSLRAFCAEHGFDPGNVSKLERGRMAPPSTDDQVDEYADALGITDDAERAHFRDLAAAEVGRIPSDLLSDAQLVEHLPVLFRALRQGPVTNPEVAALVEKLREA